MQGYKKIPVKTWYLKFAQAIPEKPTRIKAVRWENPPPDDYLTLYTTIGKDWGWAGRLQMNIKELKQLFTRTTYEVWRYFHQDRLIGLIEIDRSENNRAEIVYFGLLPEYIGKGYGKDFLDLAINLAAQQNQYKVWLHTCEFDHKNALNVYQKAGFEIYQEKIEQEYYSVEFIRGRNINNKS